MNVHSISSGLSRKRILSTAIAALVTSSSLPAFAQVLEETVVTAQKREESVQEVPISVAVTSGEKLDDFSIGGLDELSATIPNVTIGQNATQDSITIRGVGSGANHGFEQSVGTFIDGVYFGRGRFSRSPFLDIQRVEVLKGPQSVLFGKNTIAGAINITTRKPTQEFEGSIEGEYFDGDDAYATTAYVSGPLTDDLAGRLVIKYKDSNGYIKNNTTGDDEPAIEETVARGSLAWDLSDRLTLDLKAEMSSYDMDGRHLQMVDGGPFTDLFKALDPNYEESLDYERSTNNPVFGRDHDNTDAENVTATFKYDFDSVRLVSISAYNHYDYDNNIPASWVANLDTAAKRYDEDLTQYSQELRLESSGDGSFDYMAGIFYQKEEIDHTQDFEFDTAQAIADGVPLPPFVGQQKFKIKQDTESYAAFGQLTWHVSDRLRTNLGLRYTEDDKDLDYSQTVTGMLPFPSYSLKDSLTDSEVTPSVSVQYDIWDDSMMYVSFSQGFKSGGFDFESGDNFDPETVDAWEAGIKSRLADGSVELNVAVFHTEISDLQVAAWNGTAFETSNAASATTEGVEADGRWQITDSLMFSGALAYLNAEYDDFKNATCTAQQQIDSIAVGGSAGSCTQDLSGGDLQFSPEWSGTLSLQYSYQLEGGMELSSILGADYSDAYYSALDLDPVSKQDAFWKYHARIQLAGATGWSVALVGKNLSNEKTSMWVNDVPFFRGAQFAAIDPPRSIGIQARYEL